MKNFLWFSFLMFWGLIAKAQSFTAPTVSDPGTSTITSVVVQVSDPNTTEDSLEIYYKSPAGNEKYMRVLGGQNQYLIKLDNLLPNTLYEVKARVKGLCTGLPCAGPYSASVYFRTQMDFPPKVVLRNENNCPWFVGIHWDVPERWNEIEEFIIQRSFNNVSWEVIGSVHAGTRDFYDLNVLSGRTMYYTVSSRNSTGTRKSDVLTVNVLPYQNPKAPINVNSDQVNKTNHSLLIKWENPVEDTYCRTDIRARTILRYERESQPGELKYIEVPPYYNAAVIENLNEKEAVEFYVWYMSDQDKKSDFGGGRDTTLGPPKAPKDLIIVSYKDALNNSINGLSWKPGSKDSEYYIVETSTDSVNFNLLGKIKGSYNSLPHFPISEGQKYFYRVKAGNTFGESAFGPISYGIIYNYSEIPARPVGLNAKNEGGKVKLTWSDASDKEESYEIHKSVDAGLTFSKIGSVGRNVSTYVDGDVVAAKSYSYKVSAKNPLGESDFSNAASILVVSGSGTLKDVNFSVFPNPSANSVTIDIPEGLDRDQFLVKVTDQNNKTLISKVYNSKTINLSLSKLVAGVYNITVESEDFLQTKKIVKY